MIFVDGVRPRTVKRKYTNPRSQTNKKNSCVDTDSEDENHKERTNNITLSNNNIRTNKQREDRKSVHKLRWEPDI